MFIKNRENIAFFRILHEQTPDAWGVFYQTDKMTVNFADLCAAVLIDLHTEIYYNNFICPCKM